MPDTEKSKSHSIRLWKTLIAERTADLLDRREARAALVSWIDAALVAQAEPGVVRVAAPRERRWVQFPV